MKNTSAYKLTFTSKAEKYLQKLSKKDEKRAKILLNTIKKILKDPYNSKLLKGKLKGTRRVREDPYRIIFRINKKSNEIRILDLDRRSKAYKKK